MPHSAATLQEQKLKLQQATKKEGGGRDTEAGSLSSLSYSSNPDTTVKQHHAFLEVVFGLSSDVSLKKNSMALNG
jgi:hypothetical protein